jgi:H+/Cl- antiporter ClcA/CBS domain-containing protein
VRAQLPARSGSVDLRVVWVSLIAVLVALAAALVAELLTGLIGFFTNLAFYGRLSSEMRSPAQHALGPWVMAVPVVGGALVGLMARYGTKAIRGHGIPEAMEQVLTNESRIPMRMMFLKPLSAALAIGTGGPFGAEGPIIATGGALGSVVGQLLPASALERKTLLAAGAAAGMAATFGTPVAAVLLAIELLLFEYRARSLVPVALAAATATGVRIVMTSSAPAFAMPDLTQPPGGALVAYAGMGVLIGMFSVLVTRAVYAVEDAFERLPLHWMWWPALGGIAVGAVGYIEPRTLGVGYDNITQILAGELAPRALLALCGLKFVSWVISLGSGTSGGTLAPLFTIGGGVGAALGFLLVDVTPALGVDPRLAALVGMAATFAGASRALLASIVFAFETTRQPIGLLPLLAGSTAAYLTSCLLMQNSIMTEKIARRGVRALGEYSADYLDQQSVSALLHRPLATWRGADTVQAARDFLASDAPGARHQGFPVLNESGQLSGVLTRRDLQAAAPDALLRELLAARCVVVHEGCSLRDAADLMARERVGRLPIVAKDDARRVLGIITRSDLVEAHAMRLRAHERVAIERTLLRGRVAS